MKKLIALLFCSLALNSFGQSTQDIDIKTEISDVTVYLNGAQITRSKSVDLLNGRTTLKFVNLSPFIDPKSINVNVKGDLTVLSVNHQQNYLSLQNKSKEADQLTTNKLGLEKKINLEKTYIDVLKEELTFLKANNAIGGSNTGTSVNSLKEADAYFTDKFTAIKLKEIERQNTIEQLTKELDKVNSQLNVLSTKKELPTGEILVSIDAKSNTKASFEVKYIVSNAGWLPSYDIRVKNIDLPADLIYKANIHQNTNEDWNNIRLKLSSTDPKSSFIYRDIKTYYLNYNSTPPTYNTAFSNKNISQVSGHIYDKRDKVPMPGVTVMIKGTTIGTVSDINGFYSITIPQNGKALVFSFVGCKTQELTINSEQMDVVLEEDAVNLDEVVVVGYGVQSLSETPGNTTSKRQSISSKEESMQKSAPLETEQIANQTNVEFEIKTPYSIPSNGKSLTVDIENYSLPANYQYYCTPKIDKSAFLLAKIVDWEKYNLLEGEANVFFEDTYTGKTLLDVRYMADTLTLSLGKDKSVTINREIQKQYTTKQFLSNKKEETKSWLITVKNNKQQNINLSVIDQIPLSTVSEIEVNPVNISNGKLDSETGKIIWEFQLKPAEKKDIDLKYTVRYPKSRRLIIE
jgi:hypothetical protein